jgi:hypothetical protein
VLGLVPARAEADLEPAVGDVVHGHSHLGQDLRVAERVRRDEDADADLLRHRRQAT